MIHESLLVHYEMLLLLKDLVPKSTRPNEQQFQCPFHHKKCHLLNIFLLAHHNFRLHRYEPTQSVYFVKYVDEHFLHLVRHG